MSEPAERVNSAVDEIDQNADARPPDPVDWGTARRVARIVAGRDALSTSYLGASLDADFDELTVTAEGLVADFTGLRAPGNARAAVLDRRDWVDSNIASMRQLLAPLMDKFGARLAGSAFAPVSRHFAGSEIGALLGYMAQRVLGQYDLLVPEDSDDVPLLQRDAVYYVGPNILALEKRFAFRPRDFRLWIAIHEVTHRAQFMGVPWMRDYFLGLVHESFSMMDPDPRTLIRAVSNALDELRRGRNPLDEGGIVALFATPEQRGVLDQVQALMSVLEGHGNLVMGEVGRLHVAGEERMARVLQQRRNQGGLTALLQKLLGLEQKMRQYEVGERFARGVIDMGGPRALDAAWTSPAHLPTLAELDEPAAWLARVRTG